MAITRGQYLIGKVLGSCVLERLLGYGGSSAVFLAQQWAPQRKVAVKVFLQRTSMDNQTQRNFYERFLREAKAASELEHVNILPIYAYGEQDGLPYIVMPYMAGGTLAEYMMKRGPLSLQEAHWYLEQLADALDYAHEHGCVHCDVKPANILLDSHGYAMLSDFGIARLTRSESASGSISATAKGQDAMLGTPDYISPEQALGRPLDGRSDIYSLGITLFFLLTKRLPFRADSPIAMALLHVHESPPSLMQIRADITSELDGIIKKALAKKPDERFQSAGELSRAFAEAIRADEGRHIPVRSKHVHRGDEEEDPASDPRSAAVTDQPPAQVRSSWRKTFQSKFVLLVGIACILVVSTVGLTTTYKAGRVSQPGSQGKPTVSPTVQGTATVSDILADTAFWPSSSTFFYDQRHQSYHIINKLPVGVALATYYNHPFRNFRLTITLSEVQKSKEDIDYYGVVFRVSSDQSHYYLFEIAPADHAHYLFWRFDNGHWTHIKSGSISSLVTQPGKSNTLIIEAQGNTFTFAVNGKSVDTSMVDTNDRPLQAGLVGLYVENQGLEVAFSRLYIEPLE